MGRILKNLVGALKDKASISKAALFSTTTTTKTTTTTSSSSSPHLTVLRATTHHPSNEPPHPKHIEEILSFGRGSRLAASSFVAALTARLRSTHDSSVALKSLIVVHHILTHGSFILQDQLAAALHGGGGRNPLNLSAFRDSSSPVSWALSSWVRWYARVLELLLSSSRVLGTFLNNTRSTHLDEEERLTSLLNGDLMKEMEALVGVIEEMCRAPETSSVEGNRLVLEVVRLVDEDTITAEHEILVRVREMGERLDSLGFGDSVELVCLLRRLEGCEKRPLDGKWRAGDRFWSVVGEVKERAGEVVVRREKEERGRVRRERISESARIEDRVLLNTSEPVRFGSSRWVDR